MSKASKNEKLLYTYFDHLYREVGLTRKDIKSVPASGPADDACSVIADKEYVKQQFADMTFEQLRQVVCALCDNPEITSRKEAIMFLVWVAALDIAEGHYF